MTASWFADKIEQDFTGKRATLESTGEEFPG